MFFRKRTSIDFSFPVSIDELKMHVDNCFSDSDFAVQHSDFKSSGLIVIKSKMYGTTELPIIPPSIRLDLYKKTSSTQNKCDLKGELETNYLEIVGIMILLSGIILATFFSRELDFSTILTISICSILLIVVPIYKNHQIRSTSNELFELLEHVSESCRTGIEGQNQRQAHSL